MYKSIYSEASASFTEQKSEFISSICHVETEEEAIGFIEKIRANNRRARHNCYAYVIKKDGLQRYSDDGEPQGTAGAPILDVIQKNGLTDVVVVVTRYFGGILLGKGGLTRAYSSAASLAVSEAKIIELLPAAILSAKIDYSFYDRICRALPDFDARVIDSDFSDKVKIILAVREELAALLSEKLADMTNGSASLNILNNKLYDFNN